MVKHAGALPIGSIQAWITTDVSWVLYHSIGNIRLEWKDEDGGFLIITRNWLANLPVNQPVRYWWRIFHPDAMRLRMVSAARAIFHITKNFVHNEPNVSIWHGDAVHLIGTFDPSALNFCTSMGHHHSRKQAWRNSRLHTRCGNQSVFGDKKIAYRCRVVTRAYPAWPTTRLWNIFWSASILVNADKRNIKSGEESPCRKLLETVIWLSGGLTVIAQNCWIKRYGQQYSGRGLCFRGCFRRTIFQQHGTRWIRMEILKQSCHGNV